MLVPKEKVQSEMWSAREWAMRKILLYDPCFRKTVEQMK